MSENIGGALVALARGLLVPATRRGFVSRDATSCSINLGESHLPLGHSLFGRHAEKVDRFARIGLASLALGDHDGEIVLGERVAEARRKLVPDNSLRQILGTPCPVQYMTAI